jgi:hypothetical protein
VFFVPWKREGGGRSKGKKGRKDVCFQRENSTGSAESIQTMYFLFSLYHSAPVFTICFNFIFRHFPRTEITRECGTGFGAGKSRRNAASGPVFAPFCPHGGIGRLPCDKVTVIPCFRPYNKAKERKSGDTNVSNRFYAENKKNFS